MTFPDNSIQYVPCSFDTIYLFLIICYTIFLLSLSIDVSLFLYVLYLSSAFFCFANTFVKIIIFLTSIT